MTRDLFGDAPPPVSDKGEVALALVMHDQTDKAWLLAETNDARLAKWVPKSKGRRGEGRDANIWTVPTWLARDRGWL